MPKARSEQIDTLKNLFETLTKGNASEGKDIDLTKGSTITSSDGNVIINGSIALNASNSPKILDNQGAIFISDGSDNLIKNELYYKISNNSPTRIRTSASNKDDSLVNLLAVKNTTDGHDISFTNGSNIVLNDKDFSIAYASPSTNVGGNISIKAQDGTSKGDVTIESGSNGVLTFNSNKYNFKHNNDLFATLDFVDNTTSISFTNKSAFNVIKTIDAVDNSNNCVALRGGHSTGEGKTGGNVRIDGGAGSVGGSAVLAGGIGGGNVGVFGGESKNGSGGDVVITPGAGLKHNGIVKITGSGSVISLDNIENNVQNAVGHGMLWVRNDEPNTLVFTDDAGDSWNVAGVKAVESLNTILSKGNATSGNGIIFSGNSDFQDGIHIEGDGAPFVINYLSSSRGAGASINITSQQASAGTSAPGGAFIAHGGSGGTAGGIGGSARLQGGSGGGQGGIGGEAGVVGGMAGGSNTDGGIASILGGTASGKGTGGTANVTGGSSPRGDTGDVLLTTQDSRFGACGSIIAKAGNAKGAGLSGGNIQLTAGTGSDIAHAGCINLNLASGTITTFGSANSHCPRCGRDIAIEAKNKDEGWHKAVCVSCLIDTLDRHGISRSEYMIIDK